MIILGNGGTNNWGPLKAIEGRLSSIAGQSDVENCFSSGKLWQVINMYLWMSRWIAWWRDRVGCVTSDGVRTSRIGWHANCGGSSSTAFGNQSILCTRCPQPGARAQGKPGVGNMSLPGSCISPVMPTRRPFIRPSTLPGCFLLACVPFSIPVSLQPLAIHFSTSLSLPFVPPSHTWTKGVRRVGAGPHLPPQGGVEFWPSP